MAKRKKITKRAPKKSLVRKGHSAGPLRQARTQVNKGPKSTRSTWLRNQTERAIFPIAAIGASAGGLQALKEIFSSLPIETGMAFVIIQHLDPKRGSLSGEILSRTTKMPVIEIEQGMRVRPNHVYLIPPNCNLGLSKVGRFQILPRTETRGQHMPVDFFFQRLAEERKTQSVGVVLSGTACDGTQGLLAIKNEGGITLVQDPRTAKFDGMPRSAIASGAVDLICSPEGIAAELARIAKHSYVTTRAGEIDKIVPEGKSESLAKIFSILRAQTGVNFAHYKKSTIQRRLARRMLLQKTEDLNEYTAYLEKNSGEVRDLFADLLINVTSFFRDKDSFEALKIHALPKYMKGRDRSVPFRLWVVGCSTGEEVYSLVMSLLEFQLDSKSPTPIQVFASDISEQALQRARLGIYPESISENVSKDRLERFFEKVEGGGYKIAKKLRDLVLFSRHDVTRDPPFAKVDLISCRNVLIYFDSELQKAVLPIFHYALNPGGILFLGKSESVAGFSSLFSIADKTNKIYIKKGVTTPLKLQMSLLRPNSVERINTAISRVEPLPERVDLQRESDRIALAKFAPPSVVINEVLEIIQSRGRTTPFLQLSPGHASLNLLRMAHPELSAKLKKAIQTSRAKNVPVTQEGLQIHDEGRKRFLSIHVIPIPSLSMVKESYLTIFFEETDQRSEHSIGKKAQARAGTNIRNGRRQDVRFAKDENRLELERKLAVSQEYQQSLIEEYETSQEELIASNEELQSTNEELQSTNEELQSSNEELEAAKEELQSANEELIMANDEVQTRNIEMVQLNNDLSNLFTSVDIPIVIVGADGNIRRFTPKAGKVLKLIATDVGRPMGDIKPSIQVGDLSEIVSKVIESMRVKEIETQDDNGHWYRLQVRPYKTEGNRIEGAVVALIDVNAIKTQSESLRKAADDLKRARDDAASIIGAQPVPLLVVDSEKRVLIANEIFYETFKVSRTHTEGRKIAELGSGQWNIPKLMDLLQLALVEGSKFKGFEVEHEFPDIGYKTMLVSCRRAELEGSGKTVALFAIEDITERQNAIRALKDSEEKYRTLVNTVRDYAIFMLDTNGRILSWNWGAENLTGYKAEEIIGKTNALFYCSEDLQHGLMQKELQQAKENGRYVVENWRLRKDGSRYFANIVTSAFHDSKGQLQGYIKIIRDISDRIEVEQERAELLVKEKKANQVKDEFLATLSHELRTPLSIILSWAQMLQSGHLDAEKKKKALESIERSAKAQSQLIDDLLDISRIQAGKLSLRIQKIDPERIISAAVDSNRSMATCKSIEIETTIDSSIDYIYADPTRLQQILWNLIANAIKFSHKGGRIRIKLDLVYFPTGRHIRIEVSDNGKGIKSEFLTTIFERFMQVDSTSTRAYGGLGLGLSIVRKLVEMHEGTVEAESAGEGMGATFRVLLPEKLKEKMARTQTETETETETKTETETEVRLEGFRILLVDDEPSAREAFAVVLRKFGAKVKAVGSASEALESLEEFKPDILVSDIAMPTEDGYSLIKRIRALNSRFAAIPALAFTAYAGREDVQRALSAGFQSHISKPADAHKLALAISKLLESR